MTEKKIKNLMVILLIFFPIFRTNHCYAVSVGDSYGGGTVFCVSKTADITKCVTKAKETGDYGLIMANEDQANFNSNSNHGVSWSSVYSIVNGVQSLDNGASNTKAIMAAFPKDNLSNNAAWLCRNYEGSGEKHTDWYLPSINELNKMYDYAKANNLIGKNCSGSKTNGVQCLVGGYNDLYSYYWSSSEDSDYYAWAQSFGSGYQHEGDKIDNLLGIRAIRAFPISSALNFKGDTTKFKTKLGYEIEQTPAQISFASKIFSGGNNGNEYIPTLEELKKVLDELDESKSKRLLNMPLSEWGGNFLHLVFYKWSEVYLEKKDLVDGIIEKALKKGCDPNFADKSYSGNDSEHVRFIFGNTLLTMSIAEDSIPIAISLIAICNQLQIPLNLNKPSIIGSNTPLILCVAKGHHRPNKIPYSKLAEILLQNGAKPNIPDDDGSTPLHYAFLKRDQDMIDLLIKNEAKTNCKNNDGRTPLDMLDIGYMESRKIILKKVFPESNFWTPEFWSDKNEVEEECKRMFSDFDDGVATFLSEKDFNAQTVKLRQQYQSVEKTLSSSSSTTTPTPTSTVTTGNIGSSAYELK